MPSGKARMFTDQEVEQMAIKMLENKLTASDIAREYNCCTSTITHNFRNFLSIYNPELYKEVKDYLHKIKFAGHPRIFTDEELVDLANEMLENDLSSKNLGAKYYVSDTTILHNFHTYLSKYNPELYQKICQHLQNLNGCGRYRRKVFIDDGKRLKDDQYSVF